MKLALALAALLAVASPALAHEPGEHAAHQHDAAHYATAQHAEEALRGFIASAQAGTVDFATLTPELAAAVREQAGVQPMLAAKGAVTAVVHDSEPEPGTHRFRVTHADSSTHVWTIHVGGDGRIAGLMFQ
ncbi:MAG TPA: hypothetical protein VGB49_09540 [Caulobacteraceae bacterium]|jgi:hypothetical protein